MRPSKGSVNTGLTTTKQSGKCRIMFRVQRLKSAGHFPIPAAMKKEITARLAEIGTRTIDDAA